MTQTLHPALHWAYKWPIYLHNLKQSGMSSKTRTYYLQRFNLYTNWNKKIKKEEKYIYINTAIQHSFLS